MEDNYSKNVSLSLKASVNVLKKTMFFFIVDFIVNKTEINYKIDLNETRTKKPKVLKDSQ